MSRLEKTGTVSTEKAKEIGLVGLAARACGIDLDSRFDFNDEIFEELQFSRRPIKGSGDVNSRFKTRYKEIMQSISMIKKMLNMLQDIPKDSVLSQNTKIIPKILLQSLSLKVGEEESFTLQ